MFFLNYPAKDGIAVAESKAQDKKVKKAKNQPNPLVKYFRETRGELQKVTWPTPEESWRLTLIVLAVSIITAIYLGLAMDGLFSTVVKGLINLIVGATG